jgi:beta-phosphoglucomutase-like phosphatase (HAD superfamily)
MNANRCYQHVLAWKEALDVSQSGRSRRRSGSDSGRDARSGQYAKPDPDLLLAVAERLNAPIETAVVVGDSIWDMLNSLQLSLNIFSIVPERRRRNPRTKTLVCLSCRKIEKHQCG